MYSTFSLHNFIPKFDGILWTLIPALISLSNYDIIFHYTKDCRDSCGQFYNGRNSKKGRNVPEGYPGIHPSCHGGRQHHWRTAPAFLQAAPDSSGSDGRTAAYYGCAGFQMLVLWDSQGCGNGSGASVHVCGGTSPSVSQLKERSCKGADCWLRSAPFLLLLQIFFSVIYYFQCDWWPNSW